MNKSNRLLELDCLRGIAAIIVVFFHITMGRPESHYGFNLGLTGVELFFMISGFVIFLTLERAKTAKDFVISRLIRLYPAYWVAVTITSLTAIAWQKAIYYPSTFPTLSQYLFNLTMIQNYFGVANIDGPYWTLSIELLFYIVMLLVFISKKLNQINLICFFIIVVAIIHATILKSLFPYGYNFINTYLNFLCYCPLFFAGIFFYKVKFQEKTKMRLLLILFCFIAQIVTFYGAIKGNRGGLTITDTQYIAALFFYFLLFTLYTLNLLSFIVNRLTLFLGKISYSLYLIHQYIAFNILLPIFLYSRHFHFKFWPIILFIVLPTVILLGYLLNRFVEVPVMQFFKRKLLKSNHVA